MSELRQRSSVRFLSFCLFFFFLNSFFLFFKPIYPGSKIRQKEVFKNKHDFIASQIKKIYLEVKPAALVSPEGLREWQSFLGQDEDDSYKDDHLFILILEKNDEVIMWIQVTKFKAQDDRPIIKIAQDSKQIKAVIKEEATLIEKNDFEPKETELILQEILKSIEKKKKLLGIKSLELSSCQKWFFRTK